jgi:hypothetical protein
METSSLQTVLEAIAQNGDFTVRSYSGRCMYGKSCLAVTFDGNIGALFAAILYEVDGDLGNMTQDLAHAFENMAQDNMGLGTVVYFPRVEYVDPVSDEECPGCGCMPGDGITEGCEDMGGCGHNRANAPVS